MATLWVQRAQTWGNATFRALRAPAFRRYWFAQLASVIGSWVQRTAQAYLVLELTHNNAAALGWVSAVQFAPTLLFSLFAGAIIDRVSRRSVLLITQTVLLFTSLILGLATHLGFVSLPLVVALAAVAGTANAFDMPARQSMVADFVPRSDVANAVALNSLSFNVSRTLGQAVFGLIAAVGTALLANGRDGAVAGLALPFYLDVASYIYVIFVIHALPFPTREPRAGQSHMLTDIAEGLRYVRRTPAVLYTMLLVGLLSLTVINFNVIIPYFARAVYGLREAAFGGLNAAFGAGAMVGALWQAAKPNPARNLRLGSVLLLAATAALAFVGNPLWAAPVLAACGFGMLSLLISANSTVQLSLPDQLRGRVMSVYTFVLNGMGPPGAVLVSRLIDVKSGLGPTVGLGVVVLLGLLCVALLWAKLPTRVARPATPGDPPGRAR